MAENLQVDISYRQILKIALPITLASMVPQFNFVINNVFLGHLSEQALASASITGVYYLIFAGIGFGLNNGLQALISRRAGENRPEEIGKIFNQGVLISLLIAAAGIFITYFVAPYILKRNIHSRDTYEMAVEFLRIRIWGLPFLYIYQMRNALLVGINQTNYLVAGTLAEALCNVFFDYTLIFGKWGFPALGFNGAAISSVISEAAGMFVIFLVMATKGIGRQFSLLQKIRWDGTNARLITSVSGPLVFQHAISIVCWAFFFLLIEHHGKTSLAVSNTMRNVFGFFGVYIWAFASATTSMVSNVIGQGNKDHVLLLIRRTIFLNGGLTLLICIFLNLFPYTYLSIYGQDQDFLEMAVPILRLVSFIMILMSVSIVWVSAVTGSGNSRITLAIELISITLYCLYIYLILEIKYLPVFWGWTSELLYWGMVLILSYFYMKSGKWKGKVI